jgi:hypothetical protein
VFNIHPGRGLGGKPGKRLAYGLYHRFGPAPKPEEEVIVEYHGGGLRGDAWDPIPRDRIGRDILREDQEMLEIIIESILSGVIN